MLLDLHQILVLPKITRNEYRCFVVTLYKFMFNIYVLISNM